MTLTALTRARRLTAGLLLGAGLVTGGVAYELGHTQAATTAAASDASASADTTSDTADDSDAQQSQFSALTSPDSSASGAVASSHGS